MAMDKYSHEFIQFCHSIMQSVPFGIVGFGNDLKIIESNHKASALIKIDEYIDQSLALGTDNKIWENWTEQLNSAIISAETCQFDNVSYDVDGASRLLRIICSPIEDVETHENIGGVLVIEDITSQVNVQRELENTERLAAVGRLASKVAHELNNPLDGILRYINLTLRSVEQEHLEKPQEYLLHCHQGLMRMVRIVSELLEFSRSTYSAIEYDNLSKIIEDAINTMEAKIHSSSVQIVRDYTESLPKIKTGNLFQVFCNLIKNAIDAMPDGGELAIKTHLESNDTVSIEFRDTGPGFPSEHSRMIFEPFFTTKGSGKGTGLGLAICEDIVEKYNGRITAQNAKTGGSIFTVYLPLPEQEAI